jgi:phenylpropionate dioxygenase-like ring-hydroxylating dioxygenase large terminal subunit
LLDDVGNNDPMPASRAAVLDNLTPELQRAWHVVATSDEVSATPIQVWLLGQPWCLVRLGEQVVAYIDRCPHRLAPLSAGTVCHGELQCGYHGWRFAPDGACTTVPAISGAPPKRFRAGVPWAVTERFGLIWLAPEEPASPIHEFRDWDDPSFDRAMSTVVRTRAGAAQLVDNFLDAAHFPFVHAATFGTPEAAFVSDNGIMREGWSVTTTFNTWYREAGEVQPQLLRKTGSASLTVELRLDFPRTGMTIAILFCCTPEDRGSTRVYKLLARNDLAGQPDRLAAFVAEEDQILAEDLAILERYDHEGVPLERTAELHTKADRLSLGWRSVMAEFVGGTDLVVVAEEA